MKKISVQPEKRSAQRDTNAERFSRVEIRVKRDYPCE